MFRRERASSTIMDISVKKEVYSRHPPGVLSTKMAINAVPENDKGLFVKTCHCSMAGVYQHCDFHLNRPRSSSTRHLLSILRKELLEEWEEFEDSDKIDEEDNEN